MRVALHDSDATGFPNLALMKLAAWHKRQNDAVDRFQPLFRNMYEALDTLVAVVGLTAFKHDSQRAVLQEAVDIAIAALKKARGES